MKGDPTNLGFATRAIHAGQPPEKTTGAVSVPIYQTSTFAQEGLGENRGYEYARGENPTRSALEANIAALEGGLAGHAFASGMAAITTILNLVGSGERVVVSQTVYGGTHRLFTQVLEGYGIEFAWVQTSDLEAVEEAMTPNTKMLFVETPTNPLMEITDLAASAEIAHRNDALLVVDNTFLTPYFQRPIEHGADLVVHSATKYLNGHSDGLTGLVVSTRKEHADWFAFMQRSAGAIPGPMDCFLVLRGIKTLAVRMDRHQANARAVADYLVDHPAVGRVLYPGLGDHPGHEIQRRQATGDGGVLSFDLGDRERVWRFLQRLEVFTLAESLGGVESLASHPGTMTHAAVPEDQRHGAGLSDAYVRVSVGIEEIDDLIADLEHALAGLDAG